VNAQTAAGASRRLRLGKRHTTNTAPATPNQEAHPMALPLVLVALGLVLLPLAGCDKLAPGPPAPQLRSGVEIPGSDASPYGDTSVPSASAVFAAEPAAPKPEMPAGRSNAPLSAAQEAVAMPLPGQNNDHSAPLPPARAASKP
jgi:hypothetical protein